MKQIVFKLSNDYTFAHADIIKSLNDANSLDLSADSLELLKEFVYGWLTNESEIIPDLNILNSDILICNKIAYVFISELNPNLHYVGIKVNGIDYFVCSNIPNLDNCINIKKSKITRFSNGDIMEVTTPVLFPKDYPSIFRVAEMPTTYFCTKEFKNLLSSNNITGLVFEECRIKSKSWF